MSRFYQFNGDPKYPLGYQFKHYASKNLETVVGHSYTVVHRGENSHRVLDSTILYVVEHEFMGKKTRHPGVSESTIARSEEI